MTERPPPTDDAALRGVTILVVDDDDDLRRLVGFVLKRAGAEVTEAPTALEAKRAAASRRYDLVLSDVAMPDHGGHELATWLRAAHGPELLVVGLSGHANTGGRERGLAGLDAYLSKPIAPDELVERLREVLDARR